jgi:hypothetical protein
MRLDTKMYLVVALGVLATPACTEERAGKPPPASAEPSVQAPKEDQAGLRLVLPAKNADDPCDDFEKLKAMAEKSGEGAYIGCGPLPRFAIREVMGAHVDEFQACADLAKTKPEELRFKFSWTIAPDGSVHDVAAATSPGGEEGMQECLTAALKKLTFPKPMGGGTVKLTWPFVYKIGEGAR